LREELDRKVIDTEDIVRKLKVDINEIAEEVNNSRLKFPNEPDTRAKVITE
jgi:hypothetical protein